MARYFVLNELTGEREIAARCCNPHCSNHNELKPVSTMTRFYKPGRGYAYICPDCMKNEAYHGIDYIGEHDTRRIQGKGKTASELECDAKTKEGRALLSSFGKYGCEKDSSIHGNVPTEFKNRGSNNRLNGYQAFLKTVEKNTDLTDISMGQHINVSLNTPYFSDHIGTMRAYAMDIFGPLQEAIRFDGENTIFGRMFNDYAMDCSYNWDFNKHYAFINLGKDYAVEFRLCKYKTAKQYAHLTKMCREMVEAIEKWMFHHNCNKSEKEKAIQAGQKVLAIYKKYQNKKAQCQRPEYNKDGLDY